MVGSVTGMAVGSDMVSATEVGIDGSDMASNVGADVGFIGGSNSGTTMIILGIDSAASTEAMSGSAVGAG